MIGLLPDHEIRRLALAGMITPFINGKDRFGGTSRGLSSYGYDISLSDEWVTYHRGRAIIDPEIGLGRDDIMRGRASEFMLRPGCFVLGHSRERFDLPPDVTGIAIGKSSMARYGVGVLITPLEAGWRGYLTIEVSNHGVRPVLLRAGMGIAQILFVRGAAPCEAAYAGAYQDQRCGVQVSIPSGSA